MAPRRSIVIVRSKPQAVAYNARQQSVHAAALEAARQHQIQINRAKSIGGPPNPITQLVGRKKTVLPLTTPANAVFPGSAKVAQPNPTKIAPKPGAGVKTKKVTQITPAPKPRRNPLPKVNESSQAPAVRGPGPAKPPVRGPGPATPPPPVVPPTTRRAVTPAKPAANPQRQFPDTSIPQAGQLPSSSAPGDPFAGLTPQQIVDQMLAPQYAPIDQQQKQLDALYQNQQQTISDVGGLANIAGQTQGPGSIPPEYLAALSQQGLSVANYQHSQQLQQIQAAREQIAAQAPKLLYDLYTARTQSQLDAAKFALQQAQADNTALYQQQQISIKRNAANLLENATIAKLRQSGIRLNQQGQEIKLRGAIAQDQSSLRWSTLDERQKEFKVRALDSDRRFQVALARVGISQAAEARHAAETEAKLRGGGFTRSQLNTLQRHAGQIAKDAWVGKPAIQTDPATGKAVHGAIHQSYQEAVREMLAQGIPLVIAQRALNTYWTKPGTYNPAIGETPGQGRPKVSFQDRQAIAKRIAAGKRRRG